MNKNVKLILVLILILVIAFISYFIGYKKGYDNYESFFNNNDNGVKD